MNFTLADLLYSGYAFLLFALFLIPPGYFLGWTLNLLSFRKRDPGVRFLVSLPFSIAFTPILVYLAGRYSLDWPVWALYGFLFAGFAAICQFRGLRVPRFVWIVAVGWTAISTVSLVDLQIGKELYYSVVAYDYTFRTGVTGAFVRAHSLPAANPFFANGLPQPFRYHYFWFLLCSLPVRLSQTVFGHTGMNARHAVIASSGWAGLALFSTAALYVRFFLELAEESRAKVTMIAVLLFGLSGLDILPVLAQSGDGLLPTVDWWNGDQVTGWIDSMMWVPHAPAALVAGLMGWLVLWKRPAFRWQDVLGAGVAFASCVGLSVYVALVFAACAALWMFRLALKREWSAVIGWIGTGFASGSLALPFLLELAGRPGAKGSFLALEIRHFSPLLMAMRDRGWLNPLTGALADLVALPFQYFLELGFFFVVGWVCWRRQTSEAGVAGRLILLTSVGLCSVLRSNTIHMNDLGARGMLTAQFVLVLWGAQWLASDWKTQLQKNWLVKAAITVGLLTTVFELCLLRTAAIIADKDLLSGMGAIDVDENVGERGYSARTVYEKLDRILPMTAIEQHNPSGDQDILAGLYSLRQSALMDVGTATTFTGDDQGPIAVREPLQELFENKRNDPELVCRQLGIDALIVKDVDPAWDIQDGWVWKTPVLARDKRVVGLDCRGAAGPRSKPPKQ